MTNTTKAVLMGSIFFGMMNYCPSQNLPSSLGWATNCTETTLRGSIYFTFPSDTFPFNEDSLVEKCLSAVKNDLSILNQKEFTDTLNVQFLSSRKEMKWYIGSSPSGETVPFMRRIFIVVNKKNVEPPITHELMHYLTYSFWGDPPQVPTFIDEGLATYANNSCNGFSLEEIYTYLLYKNMLLPTDSLAKSFYAQPDMIAYHQSGYIVEYLIQNYGLDKLKTLWNSGFGDFEKIYGISLKNMEMEINEKITKKYSSAPDINWTVFIKGCR